MSAPASTPVRLEGERMPEGCILLRDSGSTYLDGAESWLYDTIMTTTDLRSSSTEMVLQARDWAERYHTEPARSNVMRPFDIPSDARVLEIGAGCGAVTRYLGEQAGLVDAVEPVHARARVARARTRDLPNVEVFVGLTEDVPDEPTYDIAVVIGVLEYVGAGTSDLAPYETFLREIYKRLKPDGRLILAIENKLGVKYFAGAAEDHTGRLFDSLESYPVGGIARTFARTELEALFTSAGFDAETKVAFPDYKLTRTVIDPALGTEHARELICQVPSFPSFDWYHQRPKIVDEGLLWRTFVDAGLAAETGNSLVVVGRKPGAPDPWPAGTIASYYSVGRREDHLTEVRVTVTEDGAETSRRLLNPVSDDGALHFVGGVEPVSFGQDFIGLLAASSDDEIRSHMASWLALVAEQPADRVLLDLIPQNLLVEDDGTLVVIDQEWTDDKGTWDAVVARGVLRTGIALASATAPSRWADATSVRDVVKHLATLAGLSDDTWLGRCVSAEAGLLSQIACPPYAGATGGSPQWWAEQLEGQLDQPLSSMPLGATLAEIQRDLDDALHTAVAERGSFADQVAVLTERAAALDAWAAAAVAREEELHATIGELSGTISQLSGQAGRADALAAELDRAASTIESTAALLEKERTDHHDLQVSTAALTAENTRLVAHQEALEAALGVVSADLAAARASTTWRIGARLVRLASPLQVLRARVRS